MFKFLIAVVSTTSVGQLTHFLQIRLGQHWHFHKPIISISARRPSLRCFSKTSLKSIRKTGHYY